MALYRSRMYIRGRISTQEGCLRMLEDKYLEILEKQDWSVSSYTDDGRVELEKIFASRRRFFHVRKC